MQCCPCKRQLKHHHVEPSSPWKTLRRHRQRPTPQHLRLCIRSHSCCCPQQPRKLNVWYAAPSSMRLCFLQRLSRTTHGEAIPCPKMLDLCASRRMRMRSLMIQARLTWKRGRNASRFAQTSLCASRRQGPLTTVYCHLFVRARWRLHPRSILLLILDTNNWKPAGTLGRRRVMRLVCHSMT